MTGGRSAKAKGSRFEREIVAMVEGSRRTPMSGSAGGGDLILPQWLSDYWVWECKVRQRLPGLATAALTQAEVQCRGGQRRPLAIYKQDRGPVLCSMWFPDFLQWSDVVRQARSIVDQAR